jgi:hypothetical protein
MKYSYSNSVKTKKIRLIKQEDILEALSLKTILFYKSVFKLPITLPEYYST